MEEKKYTIYMHENKINHKKYIGITSQDPEKRWRKGKNYKTCVAFNRAIEKYGWDGFEHVILFSGQSEEEAQEKEISLIKQYQTRNPQFGYNICVGGDGTSGVVFSEEVRKAISERMKGENNPNYGGKTNTPEATEKRAAKLRGKKHSEEHKQKIAASLQGRPCSENLKRVLSKISSHQVGRDDGKRYERVKDAAKELGVTYSAISNAIRRGTKCGGHYWKYVESKSLTTIESVAC